MFRYIITKYISFFIPESGSTNDPPSAHSGGSGSAVGKILDGNCTSLNEMYFVVVNVTSLFITNNSTLAFCNGSGEISTISVRHETFPCKLKWRIPEVHASGSLLLSKQLTRKHLTIYHLRGQNCSNHVNFSDTNSLSSLPEECHFQTNGFKCDKAAYNSSLCKSNYPDIDDSFIVNISTRACFNCNNPIKKPEAVLNLPMAPPTETDKPLDPELANEVMNLFTADYVNNISESSVALMMGPSITGVLMKQVDPADMEEVSFGYTKINETFNILEEKNILSNFSRSVTVSKEAFELAKSLNISEPFAAVFRFLNIAKDECNSTVLGDEVIAIEMGAVIKNLTDTININFKNFHYNGTPTCHSWNGNGSMPNWSNDGCETVIEGINITCRCTHMTFFAILMTPLNETLSSFDLNTLTTITRVGCGVSMFFLGIILFMHFIMRRGNSSNSTIILIHLVIAMFLLVFSFLVNDFVAKTKNSVGCTIMAASMHYFMLTTFTWFAAHAFHLCLQLYSGGKVQIQRYVLKVAVFSWVMPSIIIITLLGLGKYGEMTIRTENTATSASMCWILDNDVHYIVNIGYYALVFLFTFSTLILMLTWLYCMRQTQKAAQVKSGSTCQKITIIMGLCCILGVTWSCAFFAYGVFRVPAYYCFSIFNSFQGFCLFIYYYKMSRIVESNDPSSASTNSSSTLKTNLDEIFNPYDNYGTKPKPE
ncbi:adhesion G-protein coupled receptor G2-like isoform X2 [Boleophthalmus pectinirostris]|uniref:adhesion G-protein coupled receptor G2-like isoform X2 n=1 Tax=Boleophthalmus pectinirostris TaxID=150288 RepID=UPI00242C3070|nr:adhesion G-protein coupled receptor G2-like isoform X2 [Boleophthalmus pectinirostris]